MKISLSDNFTIKKLIKFTFPSVIMIIFTSIYYVVDGFFVSNFAGKRAFAALNFIVPYFYVMSSIGLMFGSGGSAIIAKTMGEGGDDEANKQFSLITYFSIAVSILFAIIGVFTVKPLAIVLGAEGEFLEDCVIYGVISFISLPGLVMQYEYEIFFVTAEKPRLGLYIILIAGGTNIILDALFVGLFKWGLAGAASATAFSYYLGSIIPLIYFARKNSSRLKLCKTNFNWKVILKATCNGASELVSNIAMSTISILYNMQLMKYAGEDGVAAYGVLMYVQYMFLSLFMGYACGVAPVVSYKYGSKNHEQLKKIRVNSEKLIFIASFIMFLASEFLAYPLSKIFVGYDNGLLEMTLRGFFIFSFSFIFAGFTIFSSSFFTALNNGLVSMIISFARTFIYQFIFILVLPIFMEIDGIWLAGVLAELLSFITAVIFIYLNKKKYQY